MSERIKTIPITLWHSPGELPVGKLLLEDGIQLDPRLHRLEMGYLKNDDQTITVVEVSICPIERVEGLENKETGDE